MKEQVMNIVVYYMLHCLQVHVVQAQVHHVERITIVQNVQNDMIEVVDIIVKIGGVGMPVHFVLVGKPPIMVVHQFQLVQAVLRVNIIVEVANLVKQVNITQQLDQIAAPSVQLDNIVLQEP
jgi:hypothetical protein